MGYIGHTLWDILWDTFVSSYGIYLTKKLRGILGKTMGYIMGYKWQCFEIIEYIKQKLKDILVKIIRNI